MPSPTTNHHRFRAGDRVVVRSAEEILSTLDSNGTLHGLPFMPEMLDWCGKPFFVERRAEKTCVDIASLSPVFPHRRFANEDVVFLDGPRCGGQDHDRCKRACKIFWKEDWLRAPDSTETQPPTSEPDRDALLPRLRTKLDEERYFCQSTQLHAATEAFPGRKAPWMLRIVLREIRNGDRGVLEILKLSLLRAWQVLLRAFHGKQWLHGPHERTTPTLSLDLKPGDKVRIKSRADIVATLNHRMRNRGMGVCPEMTRYCSGNAEVLDRVDRLIDERTGTMREIRNTVTLQKMRRKNPMMPNSDCLCANVLGDCPRGELMYWREIWLERAN